MKVLFVHRSVGRNLIEQGRMRERLSGLNVVFDDYDNNSGVLTKHDGTTDTGVIVMPGDNTNPRNLAEFFAKWPSVINDYDVIMIKSCYPNSHIKDETQLAEIQENYKSIIESFDAHSQTLFVLTSPPLRPLFTNATEARLSSRLADWLGSCVKENVKVFDFYHLLAAPAGAHQGMLKREYRRILPFDNHPNKKANQVIAPQLVVELTSLA